MVGMLTVSFTHSTSCLPVFGFHMLKIKQCVSADGASLSLKLITVCGKDGKITLCDVDDSQGNHVQKVGQSLQQPHSLAGRLCLPLSLPRVLIASVSCGSDGMVWYDITPSVVCVFRVVFFANTSAFSCPVISQWYGIQCKNNILFLLIKWQHNFRNFWTSDVFGVSKLATACIALHLESVRNAARVNLPRRQFIWLNAIRMASTSLSNIDPMCPTGAQKENKSLITTAPVLTQSATYESSVSIQDRLQEKHLTTSTKVKKSKVQNSFQL